MQKAIALLEQHVQWVAIGLGALFVLFMTYSYVLTPPARVNLGGQDRGPGSVDPYTAETVANQLQNEMNKTGRIKVTVPQHVQVFSDTMAWKTVKPLQIASGVWNSQALDVPMPVDPTIVQNPAQGTPGAQGQNPTQTAAGGKVTALPVIPKPTFVERKSGRSVVVLPAGPGEAAPQPGPGVPGVDKDWVTHMWKMSLADLERSFAAAKLPADAPQLRQTHFLNVEIAREELVNGQWVNPTTVPALPVTRDNQPLMAYPGDQADRGAQFAYSQWAATHTADIIQPVFYTTTPGKGDTWTKPGAQAVVEGQAFDPATHVGPQGALTDEQWQLVLQFRREQSKLKDEQRKAAIPSRASPRGGPGGAMEGGPGGPGGYGPGGPGGRGGYAPARPQRAEPNYAPAPGLRPPPVPPYPQPRGRYPGNPAMDEPMPGAMEGGYGGYGGYGGSAGQPQGLPQPGTDYPSGAFDPADPAAAQTWKGKDVEIWAHDETLKAGKTYRYRMRYRMKNPIFQAANVANPPTLSDQFALVSEWSDWSESFTVPSLINFFVAGSKALNGNTIRFEVFRWDNGQQNVEVFNVGPGDLVGGAKGGLDYQTEWTLVDFREDPARAGSNEWQVLLVNNADGNVQVRSFKTDRDDKLYKALKAQTEALKAANTAAANANATAAGASIPPGQ